MSRMVMVRHGQASFLANNYDKLSTRGRQQSHQLGLHWLRSGVRFDEVYCGPRERHRETVEQIRACYQEAEVPWPETQTLDEFDEHQVDQAVLKHAAPLAARSDSLRERFLAYQQSETSDDIHRNFQQLFEAVAALWQVEQIGDVESWPEFQRRVNRGLNYILERSGHGRSVAVVTSVGPITVALQRAMACADDVALRTGWRIWNGSLSEFVFSGDRFTLDVYNAVPHLERDNRTYR